MNGQYTQVSSAMNAVLGISVALRVSRWALPTPCGVEDGGRWYPHRVICCSLSFYIFICAVTLFKASGPVVMLVITFLLNRLT